MFQESNFECGSPETLHLDSSKTYSYGHLATTAFARTQALLWGGTAPYSNTL